MTRPRGRFDGLNSSTIVVTSRNCVFIVSNVGSLAEGGVDCAVSLKWRDTQAPTNASGYMSLMKNGCESTIFHPALQFSFTNPPFSVTYAGISGS